MYIYEQKEDPAALDMTECNVETCSVTSKKIECLSLLSLAEPKQSKKRAIKQNRCKKEKEKEKYGVGSHC